MNSVIYPGSFDPVTYGHIDVIKRAAEMFDDVIVCILDNRAKTSLFSIDERVKMLQKVSENIPNVKIDTFYGLLVDYADKVNVHTVIRGLRAVTDYEYELQIAQTNRMISGGKLDTIFLTTSLEYEYISSSGVKEIASFGGPLELLVPPEVEEMVVEKYPHAYNKNSMERLKGDSYEQ